MATDPSLAVVPELAPELSAEDERARADELQERNRELLFERAVGKLSLQPSAIESAKALIDWDAVDVDDPAAVERALGSLRREGHGYLFQSRDIGAGARNYARGAGLEDGLTPKQRIERGYE